MNIFKVNKINAQVVQIKADRQLSKSNKQSAKQIKKGIVVNNDSFSIHLDTIDNLYDHLEATINNATSLNNYTKIRGKKVAQTRQLIEFYNADISELNNIKAIIDSKSKALGLPDSLKKNIFIPPDLKKAKENFQKIVNEGNKNVK